MPKLVTRAVGVVLVLIGIVLFILPIPVGWLVIGIGIAFPAVTMSVHCENSLITIVKTTVG